MTAHEPFSVWAPSAQDVRLHLDDQIYPMRPIDGGWWSGDMIAEPGMRYGFGLYNGQEWSKPLPDPRSTAQPDGVHGLSEVTDPDFKWSSSWTGRPLSAQVIYELHVGTFTPEGTFEAIIDRLDYLRDLGVTTIELMPIQPFGGDRNWGYDGVSWHAVHHSYGGPEGLKKLVDAAHSAGLAVFLDVVYNHFGPDGNYNGMFGPYTSGGSTDWGEVVNISGPNSDEVRSFILDSVALWLVEYRIDGLRLDAVHAYDDHGAYSLMEQIQYIADDVASRTGVPRSIIAESDLNDPRLITENAAGGFGLAGQWVDDIHHALHTMVTGERHAYYEDYGSVDALAKTLREGFFYTGNFSSFRGRAHGRPLDLVNTPAHRLVTYTTTHDQVGNRASGDRPSMNLTATQQVLKAAIIYSSPYTPMLFMGEEFGAQTPFAFFCSHTDEELNRLTTEGRRREFSRSGWSDDEVPAPSDPATFAASKLDWDFNPEQREILSAYRQLLRLRKELGLSRSDLTRLIVEVGSEDEPWLAMGHPEVMLVANLSDKKLSVPFGGELIYSFSSPAVGESSTELGPWEFALLRR
ncbi:malto-oligosyltrehalose trehalohydrolase [Corynebacterium alimapuense]|uniref:Malto-oligosyltrehalose trehalohydrolase n=1 Tax=Corynebacterium alimapuense TaxID=1576874 RepID=A0A3M8KAE5_9CORY|nr:malto-oligosyltrehalose trehalohydrolase [Corynebacterium alimapuense]RNE49765.1 malto-oligosyltrehalose trehalohydrolase [Corynebacterium alimapuense]